MRAVALAAVAVTLVCARAMPMFEEDVEEVTCPPGMAFNACGTPCHKTCASEASGKPGRMCIQVCRAGCFCPSDKWVSKDGKSCHASFEDCPTGGEATTNDNAFDLGEPQIFPRGPGVF